MLEIAGHLRNWYASLEENIIQNVSKDAKERQKDAPGESIVAEQSTDAARDECDSTSEQADDIPIVTRRATAGASILKQSRNPSGKRVRWDSSGNLSELDSSGSTRPFAKTANGGNGSKIASAFSTMLQNCTRPGLGKFNIFGPRRQLITARAY